MMAKVPKEITGQIQNTTAMLFGTTIQAIWGCWTQQLSLISSRLIANKEQITHTYESHER